MPVVLHVGCGPKTILGLPPFFQDGTWSEVRLDIDPAVKPDVTGTMTDMSAVATGSVQAVFLVPQRRAPLPARGPDRARRIPARAVGRRLRARHLPGPPGRRRARCRGAADRARLPVRHGADLAARHPLRPPGLHRGRQPLHGPSRRLHHGGRWPRPWPIPASARRPRSGGPRRSICGRWAAPAPQPEGDLRQLAARLFPGD